MEKKKIKNKYSENRHWRFLLAEMADTSHRYEQDFMMTQEFFTQEEHATVKAEMMKFAERLIDEFLKENYK